MYARQTLRGAQLLWCSVAAGCEGSAIDTNANKLLRGKLGNTSFTVFPAVVRHGGNLSYGLNSHQSEFSTLNPRNVEDCTRLVVETLGPQLHHEH